MSHYLRLNLRDAVKVGTTRLPGVLTALAVNGALEVTQDKLESTSAHLTSVEGYTTATVTLEIVLLGTDEEREGQLRIINGVFYVNPQEGKSMGKAGAWRVVNPHLDARRIRQLLFTRFDSRDGNEDDSTVVSLEFREILQEQVRLEKAAEQDAALSGGQAGELELPGGAASTPPGGANPAPATPPAPLNPFLQGLQNGQALVSGPAATP